jgi:hypothetical protein
MPHNRSRLGQKKKSETITTRKRVKERETRQRALKGPGCCLVVGAVLRVISVSESAPRFRYCLSSIRAANQGLFVPSFFAS